MIKTCDVLIVGTGIAGVYTALNLNKNLKIKLISKESIRECDSYLAQGGICTALDNEDIPYYIEDTLIAGNYKNDPSAVEVLVQESIENIERLINFNVPFDRNDNGSLSFTREGGHSKFRIAHVKDETGKYIMESLFKEVNKRNNIEVIENCKLIDIIKKKNKCLGGICNYKNSKIQIHSNYTILATGGLGGLFTSTTNLPSLTGDGISIALKNGISIKDINYLQLHPTVLYEEGSTGKRLLLSESLRGEGAILRNLDGCEFINPLKPRDVVSKAILKEIEKTPDKPYVYLDLTHLNKQFLANRFPYLYNECLKRGYAMENDMLPISPAHHYAMGGIYVDLYGRTSLNHLYAVGETACTGVHGNNRLASNSLLEAVVFGYRCADKINSILSYSNNSSYPKQDDLIKFLKEKVDDNYAKLLIIDKLIKEALQEDMPFGDITTIATINENTTCTASLYVKEDGIICGLPVFERVFSLLGNVEVNTNIKDGDKVFNGEKIATLKGNARNILMGERIALNLLQRMSGIATTTRRYADTIKETSCKVVDTRKVTPLYRHLDKYSVLCGGGSNHRFSLSDSILIKDNHIDAAGGIKEAISLAKKHSSFTTKIEVETETKENVLDALESKADIIMLDNMSPDMAKEMIELINKRAITECSGNITLDTILNYAKTGVDYISVGALTHSFKVLDISLKNLVLE